MKRLLLMIAVLSFSGAAFGQDLNANKCFETIPDTYQGQPVWLVWRIGSCQQRLANPRPPNRQRVTAEDVVAKNILVADRVVVVYPRDGVARTSTSTDAGTIVWPSMAGATTSARGLLLYMGNLEKSLPPDGVEDYSDVGIVYEGDHEIQLTFAEFKKRVTQGLILSSKGNGKSVWAVPPVSRKCEGQSPKDCISWTGTLLGTENIKYAHAQQLSQAERKEVALRALNVKDDPDGADANAFVAIIPNGKIVCYECVGQRSGTVIGRVKLNNLLALKALDHAHAQGGPPKAIVETPVAPVISDKQALVIRTEQLSLTQLQMQLHAIRERYQKVLDADPDYKKVGEAIKSHQGVFTEASKGVCGGDDKKFILNYEKLVCVAPEPAAETPKAPVKQ